MFSCGEGRLAHVEIRACLATPESELSFKLDGCLVPCADSFYRPRPAAF